MCLGIPGRVTEVERSDLGVVTGKVDFGGVLKQVNLSFTPEVEVDQYVVVHVGFSISTLDETEARQIFRHLEELGIVDELNALDDSVPQFEPPERKPPT